MAFCNNNCRCGHACGRADDHGGACDCRDEGCPAATCPKCDHPMWEHRAERGQSYRCWYSMSNENNDWCGCEHGKPAPETYTFYAIADNDDLKRARWYRTYSSAHRRGWVDSLGNAKVWAKKGQAQGKCTQLGASARLVEFVATNVVIHDQAARLRELEEKKKLREAAQREQRAKAELEAAHRALMTAQENFERLTKGKL